MTRELSGSASPAEPRRGARTASRRPASHRLVAVALLLVSVVVVLLNDAVVVGAAPGWMAPGGLHEVYGFGGFMFAAASTWWFGWFDRR